MQCYKAVQSQSLIDMTMILFSASLAYWWLKWGFWVPVTPFTEWHLNGGGGEWGCCVNVMHGPLMPWWQNSYSGNQMPLHLKWRTLSWKKGWFRGAAKLTWSQPGPSQDVCHPCFSSKKLKEANGHQGKNKSWISWMAEIVIEPLRLS